MKTNTDPAIIIESVEAHLSLYRENVAKANETVKAIIVRRNEGKASALAVSEAIASRADWEARLAAVESILTYVAEVE